MAQHVRKLEERLGFALFQRHPRGLTLTTKGAAYCAEISRAFEIMSNATTQVLGSANSVTISVTPTFASKLLLPKLPALNAALPTIELRTLATETLSDFDRDQVDIAVRLTRPPFPAALEARHLFGQELVAVASPHLIRDTRLPISTDQLHRWPLLHDAHGHWPRFLQTDAALPGSTFSQTALALDAALAGQGIALSCRAFVQADLDAGRLIEIAEPCTLDGPAYYLVRKRSTTTQQALDAVWNWCIENL